MKPIFIPSGQSILYLIWCCWPFFIYEMVDNTMEFLLRTGVLLTILQVKRGTTSPNSNSNLAVISNVSRSCVFPIKNCISPYWSWETQFYQIVFCIAFLQLNFHCSDRPGCIFFSIIFFMFPCSKQPLVRAYHLYLLSDLISDRAHE